MAVLLLLILNIKLVGPEIGVAYTINAASSDTYLRELPAGKYQATIIDDEDCSYILEPEIEITAPEVLAVSEVVVTAVSCFGGNDGKATAIVTGGDGSYNYNWIYTDTPSVTFTNTAQITQLSVGDYEVTVTDTSGASTTAIFSVDEPSSALSITETITDVLCYGDGTGEIEIAVNGGTPPYRYLWNNGETTPRIDTLLAGDYTVTITDDNNCEIQDTYTITQPLAALELAIESFDQITSFGAADGAITVSATGGTAPYDYSWTSDIGFTSNDQAISNLSPGDYTIVVTDANAPGAGCLVEQTFEIREPSELKAAIASGEFISCAGNSDGALIAEASGGVGPYSYEWFEIVDGQATAIGQTTVTASNLITGDYQVEITDASDIVVTSDIYTLSEPMPLVLASQQVGGIRCFGAATGSIIITVAGGTPPYSFIWDNGAETKDVENLTAGTYTIFIIDENGCSIEQGFTVGQPDEPLVLSEETVTQISAFGETNGSISVNASGGTNPYAYSWTSTIGFTSSEPAIDNLASGDYTVVVTDANASVDTSEGCRLERTFQIREPGELLVSIQEEEFIYCAGEQSAILLAAVSGGVSPYSYEWYKLVDDTPTSIGQTTAMATDLSAGTYHVVVTDVNMISRTSETIIISEPDPLVIGLDVLTDVACFGAATGQINTVISGGVSPYTLSWNTGPTTSELENIPSGTYTLEVIDANQCVVSRTFEVVDEAPALEIENAQITDASEYNAADGAIALDIIGGTLDYTITWRFIETDQIVGTSSTISGLIAGIYEIQIIDAKGCVLINQYTITEPDIVAEIIIAPTCTDDCDGSIQVEVNEGNGNFTYVWSTGATTSSITDVCAGSYTVTIEGFNNETLVRTYTLENPDPIVVELGEDRTLCVSQYLELDASIAQENISYQWTSDTGFTATTPRVTVADAGIYTVTATTLDGCVGQDEIIISTSNDIITSEFLMSSQVFVEERFTIIDISDPLPDEIVWSYPEAAIIDVEDQDLLEMYFEEGGQYEIGLTTYIGDCEITTIKTIIVLERDESMEASQEIEEDAIEVVMYPNPTDGNFTIDIDLQETGSVSVRVFSLANNTMWDTYQGSGEDFYTLSMDITNAASGLYAAVIETANRSMVLKIIRN